MATPDDMSRSQVIQLYRNVLRAASSFKDYNFRSYALRRAKDSFRAHAQADSSEVPALLRAGNDEFLRLSRMAMVNSMFASKEAVVDVMKREGGIPGRK